MRAMNKTRLVIGLRNYTYQDEWYTSFQVYINSMQGSQCTCMALLAESMQLAEVLC